MSAHSRITDPPGPKTPGVVAECAGRGTPDAPVARMLLPFSPEPEQPQTPPDVVSIENLGYDAIEEAEAEIEAEENEWPATA